MSSTGGALQLAVSAVMVVAVLLQPEISLFALAAAGLSVSAAIYSNLQTDKMKQAAAAKLQAARDAYNASLEDRTTNALSNESPVTTVYGRALVGGSLIACFTSGSKDQYRHMVFILAGHELNAVTNIYLNDTEVWTDGSKISSDYSSYIPNIAVHLGADTEADSYLISQLPDYWTSEHKLTGYAYLVVTIDLNESDFQSGFPSITAVVEGKKLYDPRDGTTAYSTNPALCIRDFLTDKYGLNQPTSHIDDTAFITVANQCDAAATLVDPLFTCNGTWTTDQDAQQILNYLSDSMAGATYCGLGGWTCYAGVWTAPSFEITDDDFVEGFELIPSASIATTMNTVRGQFFDEDEDWDYTDYTEYQNSVFLEADGQEYLYDFNLPFTSSDQRCQNLCRIYVERARQGLVLTGSFKMRTFQVQPGDRVWVSNTLFGWDQKIFIVLSKEFSVNQAVKLVLQEDAEAVYDEADEVVADISPNTGLGDPFAVSAPALVVSDALSSYNESYIVKLQVLATSSNFMLVTYEVQARVLGDTAWTNLGQSTSDYFELANVASDSIYEIRARAISRFGTYSDYTYVTYQVVGETEVPSDVTGFGITMSGSTAYLSWDAVADLDLSHYIIRYSSSTSSTDYATASTLIEKIARPATSITTPAVTGTYFIKAVDKSGYVSAVATSASVVYDEVNYTNIVLSTVENDSYLGNKTNCEYDDYRSGLILSTASFDAHAGTFDSTYGTFNSGGNTVQSLGYYDLYCNGLGYLDLGSSIPSSAVFSIVWERTDFTNYFDDHTGLFDEYLGDFDGEVTQFDDVSCSVQVSTTNDDPSSPAAIWTDYTSFVVSQQTVRAYRFRLKMTSSNSAATPLVSELSARILLPKITVAGNDINSGTTTSGYYVAYPSSFYSVASVTIGAQNMPSGAYYTITDKSTEGFNIEFFNSSGSTIDITFDYTATGY